MGRRLLVILGPTAVGKTDYSIEKALEYGSPVISCDSRQFYKEMRIGTAVPTPEQLARVRHYFIQDRSVATSYTAGMYEAEALALIGRLFDEGNQHAFRTETGYRRHYEARPLDDGKTTGVPGAAQSLAVEDALEALGLARAHHIGDADVAAELEVLAAVGLTFIDVLGQEIPACRAVDDIGVGGGATTAPAFG